MTTIPNVLTVAGSDSGGGAGIQADLKALSANRVFGASVLTALTAQNTRGVTAIHDVPADFITAQLDAVFSDIRIDAVKIGMLSQVPAIEAVAAALTKYQPKNIVFDPVMVATSGDLLLAEDAVEAVRSVLMPLATVITPNLHEAATLTGLPLAESDEAMILQAEALNRSGAKAALVKGGHGAGRIFEGITGGKEIKVGCDVNVKKFHECQPPSSWRVLPKTSSTVLYPVIVRPVCRTHCGRP